MSEPPTELVDPGQCGFPQVFAKCWEWEQGSTIVLPTGTTIGALSAFESATSCLSALAILLFLCYQVYRTRRGSLRASRRIIFPGYFALLILLAPSIGMRTVVTLLFDIKETIIFTAPSAHVILGSVLYGITYGVNHAICDGVTFILLQYGVGKRSMRRFIVCAVIWGLIVTVFNACSFVYSSTLLGLGLNLGWQALLATMYGAILIIPARYLHRRPALNKYALFWLLYRLVRMASTCFRHYCLSASFCLDFSFHIVFGILEPISVYLALLQDCRYWQGLLSGDTSDDESVKWAIEQSSHQQGGARRAMSGGSGGSSSAESPKQRSEDFSELEGLGFDVSLSSSSEHRSLSHLQRSLMPGLSISNAGALELAESLDRVAHGGARSGLRKLNWAEVVSPLRPRLIGTGGTARVFEARYRTLPVAVKLGVAIEITPAVIRDFLLEAQLLGRLRHPLVVETIGVCVVPPSLAIVLELCQHGSLLDVLHSDCLLDTATRLSLMLDCVGAVAFLHGRGILHRDVKSMNFLVFDKRATSAPFDSATLRAKITDLGESVELAPPDEGESVDLDVVAGPPTTKAWSAPEIFTRRAHSTASDIYALSIVLWEIWTRQRPWNDLIREGGIWEIEEKVTAGVRLSLTEFPAPLAAILESMWTTDPVQRPSASEVLSSILAIMHSRQF